MTEPQWWELRPAQNLDAKTYRCPLCGEFLPSASVHVLLLPEGDTVAAPARAHRVRGGRAAGGEAAEQAGVALGAAAAPVERAALAAVSAKPG